MFAKTTKKFEVALNKGIDGTKKYFPGDVAEGRHAEIGLEMGRAIEIDAEDAELPPDHSAVGGSTDAGAGSGTSDDDDLSSADILAMRTHADLDEVFQANELTIEGFADMKVDDKKAALISEFWPEEAGKATKPASNKAVTPPANKSA